MESILAHAVAAWAPLLCALIFLGMVFEGEAALFAGTFLAHQGALSLPLVLVTAGTGLIIGDLSWYWAGKHLLHKIPFLARLSHRVTGVFDKHLKRRPFTTILLSKFAYGIHRAVLLRAGQHKIPFKEYARIIVCANIIWGSIVVFLAIGVSASVGHVRHLFRYIELIILVVLLIFVFFDRIAAFVSEYFLEEEIIDTP